MGISSIGSLASPITSSQPTSGTVTAGTSSTQDRRAQRTQFRSDFASLLSAVQSGDMSAAQQSLSAVQSDMSAQSATYGQSGTAPTGQIGSDIQSLFDAVRKGDAPAAQQALSQLQSDRQQPTQTNAAPPHGHHHHHHHHGSASNATTATNAVTQPDALTTGQTTSQPSS